MMTKHIDYKNQKILIVDDNYNNILVIKLILEANQVGEIYDATTAEKAYDILKSHKIDAVLLDVLMPDTDGIEICTEIRRNKGYDLIPILMITADKGDYSLKKSFDAGANDYIEQPINSIALMGRLNSQLRQREMEQCMIEDSRYTAKNELTSMLAHQWRQPLSNINSMTTSIQTKLMLDKIDKKQTIDALKEVETAIVNLSELINSFNMTFSSQTNTSIFDINALIDNILILLQPLLDQYHITLNKKSEIQKIFELDRQSLSQVIINILNNCIDALKEPSVADPTITIETLYQNNKLIIKIEDNGKGIEQVHLANVYEPYFSTKESTNGKGLGLYHVKHLLKYNLNGDITISSDQELTTATIILDIKD